MSVLPLFIELLKPLLGFLSGGWKGTRKSLIVGIYLLWKNTDTCMPANHHL